ncbi:hypothetical protein CVT24_003486 [Panaeolus cyanescens]|uniref:Uncharacterized protein n=1 Tax=Panaeolus cyanescens TaxID=181874 RepID=A0A409Y7S4_9AGAR|nr:hypothetical protein CVT24_003486 [Panaeolus cyanescens]
MVLTWQSVFLVGGFAANSYLFNEVKDKFSPQGIDVSRPDPNRVNKAVADGAISFYLEGFVAARMARVHYGTDVSVPYKATDVSHRTRSSEVYVDCLGIPHLDGLFSNILSKGTRVTETQEFRAPYIEHSLSRESLTTVKFPIMCYRGNVKDIQWFDEDPDMFHTLCHVEADMKSMAKGLKPRYHDVNGDGTLKYYELDYQAVLTFGTTELTAHVEWEENGITKSSPAKLIYDADAEIPSANH